MKFKLKKSFRENIYNLMRKIGYHFLGKNEEKKEIVFVRPPRGYPRFHLFLKIEGEESKLSSSPFADAQEKGNLVFNLHLDQKRPIYPHTKRGQGAVGTKINKVNPRYGVGVYKGAPAHAGEYEGEVVEKEAKRIKEILK